MLRNVFASKYKKRFLILVFGLFSIEPYLADVIVGVSKIQLNGLSTIGALGEWEYNIVNFILLYIIGCYIRSEENHKCENLFIKLMSLWIIEAFMYYIEVRHGIMLCAEHYHDPIVILMAYYTFMLFLGFDIKNCKPINAIARGTYTTYLLHAGFIGAFPIVEIAKQSILLMCLKLICCALAIFFTCYVIFLCYDFLTKRINNTILNRLIAKLNSFKIELE